MRAPYLSDDGLSRREGYVSCERAKKDGCMSQAVSDEVLQRLLDTDAPDVLAWVDGVFADTQQASGDVNWLGLAEAAAFRAVTRSDLPWARVATTVYDHLHQTAAFGHEQSSIDPDPAEDSAMHVRVAMIARFGGRAGDSVLDIGHLIGQIDASLTLSRDEAGRLAASFHEWSFDQWPRHVGELRQLRAIKDRLTILKTLVASGALQPTEQQRSWIALWDELP